jgi:NAD(P)-dependent dehydrogenase (short-subunit alcohol dehydrogenase family)
VIAARDPGKGEQVAALLRTEGLEVDAIALDVNDPARVERAADELTERYGTLDVLVNNAGILPEAEGEPGEIISTTMFRQDVRHEPVRRSFHD